MANMNWSYDENSGRYVVKGARILFPNFAGEEQDYNAKGRRNFRLQLDEDLASELKERGVYVRERPPRNDDEDTQYLVKIGVYPSADVRLLSGRTMTQLNVDNFDLVDKEFRKGEVENGNIGLEFHVSRNTKVSNGALYVRLDTCVLPIRKSALLEDYEYDEDDELPM